jgi:hypothetical protein
VLTVNLPLLTIPLRQDQILISKFLVGRKTSEVVENANESSFGEGQPPEGVSDSVMRIITSDGTKPRQALNIVSSLIKSANYICGAAIIVLRRIVSKTDATHGRVYNCERPLVNDSPYQMN